MFACIWTLRQITFFLKRFFSTETKARVRNTFCNRLYYMAENNYTAKCQQYPSKISNRRETVSFQVPRYSAACGREQRHRSAGNAAAIDHSVSLRRYWYTRRSIGVKRSTWKFSDYPIARIQRPSYFVGYKNYYKIMIE